jgi:hypothetical protein
MELRLSTAGLPVSSGMIRGIRILLDAFGGTPDATQLVTAQRLEVDLPRISRQAADYLDLFVDRASGNAEACWWLDEIDFRSHVGLEPRTYGLLFSLDGDDGGAWTVDVRVTDTGHRPFRFERYQG